MVKLPIQNGEPLWLSGREIKNKWKTRRSQPRQKETVFSKRCFKIKLFDEF
jgi:hypothetical protein